MIKVLYKPVSMLVSVLTVLGGVLAGAIFNRSGRLPPVKTTRPRPPMPSVAGGRS